MQRSSRSKILTASLTAKLTSAEEHQVAQAADKCGQTKSQWLRQAITQALRGSQDTRLILAEVIGARAIVVALLARISTGTQITDEVVKGVVDQVNLVKAAAAEKRIHAASGGGQ